MYEIDTTALGGDVLRFHPHLQSGPITWQGVQYSPWPLVAQGFERTGNASQPSPTLNVSNVDGSISALCILLGDCVGAKVRRHRTLSRYLDKQNFPGWQGYALSCSGTAGNYAQLASAALPALTGDLTVCLSLKPTAFGSRICPVSKSYSSEFGIVQEFDGSLNLYHGNMTTQGGASGTNYESFGSYDNLTQGAWNTAVVRRTAATSKVQWAINNDIRPTQTAKLTPAASTLPLTVGQGWAGAYNGQIDKVMIFSRVLTDVEAQAYMSGAASTIDTTGLVGYWDFEQSLADSSINGRTLSSVGSLSYSLIYDSNPASDPTAEMPIELWYVEQKTGEDNTVVEFTLSSVLDFSGRQLPNRQVIAHLCPAEWTYRGPICGYAGTAYFDANNNPVSDPTKDVCGRRLSSCKCRFGNNPLPFGGYPASGTAGTLQ